MTQVTQPSGFYVHVVESQSANDLLDGRSHGRTLCEFLRHANIPFRYFNVVDHRRLSIALGDRLKTASRELNSVPIIHLAMHGNENGVALTSQSDTLGIVSWPELAAMLRPIHIASLPTGLGVCMSSCKGISGKAMANTLNPADIPFSWLVGFGHNVQWIDLSLAYTVFYRRYHQGVTGDALINVVRTASGLSDFEVATGTIIQQSHQTHVHQQTLQNLQTFEVAHVGG